MTDRLTFGSYRIPCNPRTLKTVCSRRILHRFSPFCGDVVEDYGPELSKVNGEGTFFGRDAEKNLALLRKLFRESGKETLTAGGESFPAFFTNLTVSRPSDSREIRFSFEFTEAP